MSKYFKDEKRLTVCPYTGINRKVVTNDSKEFKWELGEIIINDYSKTKRYEVFFAFSNNIDYPLFARPKEKYMDALFEELFIFKCQCFDFNTKKIIGFSKDTFVITK